MAYTPTSLLSLPIITTGSESGLWGDVTNNGLTQYLDIAIAGALSVTATTTLANTAGTNSATGITTTTAQYRTLVVPAAGVAANVVITAPSSNRTYHVINRNATYTVQIRAGANSGVTLGVNQSATVAYNTVAADYVLVGTIGPTVPVANGGTGLTSGTSGGVLYYSGTGTLASSGALAASSLVLGGGAGAAPTTTTTGTGVVTAVGNAVNTTGGLVTQSGTLASSALLLGGGAATAITSTTTGTGVVTAVGNAVNTTGGLVTQSGTLAASALLIGGGASTAVSSTTTGTGILTFLGTPSSANLAAAVTDETGSGALVFATSPSLTTPVLGTPTSGNLSNCTADGTSSVGFRNIPQNSQSTAYTLVLADSGKHILHPSADTTARTFTIPANSSVAFPIGTAITFVNQNGAGVVTIAITTDTMRLSPAGTTGSRTLAANGVATCIKLTSTEWIISGTGLT